MNSDSRLYIDLFGGFNLLHGQYPITTLPGAKGQALLAYLLLHRESLHTRQFLAYLFWPNSSESQARTNLRQTLHQLRQRVPHAKKLIHADSKTLRWNLLEPFSLDVANFTQTLKEASQAKHQNNRVTEIQLLENATHLYRGQLLPNCYEDWVFQEREYLQQQAIEAIARLTLLHENNRDTEIAIHYAKKLLKIDPLHESTYQSLMRLYLAQGDRSSALQTYEQCSTVFHEKLGVEPSQSTCDLYHHVLNIEAKLPLKPFRCEAQHDNWSTFPPLVGRVCEWKQLQTDWCRSMTGQARFVLIQGEAGIGKSRLAEELFIYCRKRQRLAIRTRCYAAEGRLSYAPITDWLRNTGMKTYLRNLNPVWLTELTRLLPELLTDYKNLSRAQPLTESWQRQNFYEAIVQAFQLWLTTPCYKTHHPALFIIDDLQWCDLETLEWLQFFLRVARQHPILIVGTARNEDLDNHHPLPALLRSLYQEEQITEIHLNRLDIKETETLASHLSPSELTPAQVSMLFHESEGHPLFIVEMMRANLLEHFHEINVEPDDVLLSTNQTSDCAPPLPPKVEAILSTRLAQLSPSARKLISVAATIGRRFTTEILQYSSGTDEETLVQDLDEIWQYRIVREHDVKTYDFSHDKLREVAYKTIHGPQRRLLHRRVAHALEAIYEDNLDVVSTQIATHYEKAGLPSKAVPYYLHTAEVAQRIFANREAIYAFKQALKLLQTMPLNKNRLEKELALNTRLGVSLVALQGFGSLEVKSVYEQARSLANQLGYPSNPPVLRALAISAIVQGDSKSALELGNQMIAWSDEEDDTILEVEAHYVMGASTFRLGLLHDSQHHFEHAIKQFCPEYQVDHLALYAQDPYAICHSQLAFTLWFLGRLNESTNANRIAVSAARQLSHPFTLAYTLTWTTLLHSHHRDIKMTAHYAADVISLCEQKELGVWLAIGRVLQGWALAHSSTDIEARQTAIQQMHAALEILHQMGSKCVRPYFLSLLADAYSLQDDYEAAMEHLRQAFDAMNLSNERWVESELYWRQGELLRLQGASNSTIQSSFKQALAIAQAQGTYLFELQAVISLLSLTETSNKTQPCPTQYCSEYCSDEFTSWLKQTQPSPQHEGKLLIFQQARTLFRTIL